MTPVLFLDEHSWESRSCTGGRGIRTLGDISATRLPSVRAIDHSISLQNRGHCKTELFCKKQLLIFLRRVFSFFKKGVYTLDMKKVTVSKLASKNYEQSRSKKKEVGVQEHLQKGLSLSESLGSSRKGSRRMRFGAEVQVESETVEFVDSQFLK